MLFIASLHHVFGRLLAGVMSPFASGFYVLAFAAVELFIIMAVGRKIQWSIFRKHIGFFTIIGILVAGATIFSYLALTLIDAGTASLVSRSSTVVTLALSFFWLRESLSRNELIGAFICIIGVFIIGFQSGNVFRVGSLLTFGAVVCYALHIAIVKRYGEAIEFNNFFLFRVFMTAVFLGVFMAMSGQMILPPTVNAWWLLFIIGTVDVVISRFLYYWVLRQMRLGMHTIALTATPVLTILISWLFLKESLTRQGAIGGIIVMVGILLVVLTQNKRTQP